MTTNEFRTIANNYFNTASAEEVLDLLEDCCNYTETSNISFGTDDRFVCFKFAERVINKRAKLVETEFLFALDDPEPDNPEYKINPIAIMVVVSKVDSIENPYIKFSDSRFMEVRDYTDKDKENYTIAFTKLLCIDVKAKKGIKINNLFNIELKISDSHGNVFWA